MFYTYEILRTGKKISVGQGPGSAQVTSKQGKAIAEARYRAVAKARKAKK